MAVAEPGYRGAMSQTQEQQGHEVEGRRTGPQVTTVGQGRRA